MIVGLVLAMQLMLRTGRTADADLATVRALGMSFAGTSRRGGRRRRRGGWPRQASVLLGVVLTVRVVSRSWPRSSSSCPSGWPGSLILPPGVHADLTVLAVGVLVTLSAAVVMRGVGRVPAPQRGCPRRRPQDPPFPAVPTRAPHAAARGDGHADGGGATRPRRRRRPAAFAGIATVAASFVGILGLTASFRHLLAHPQLSGATWDAAVFYYESLAEAKKAR